MQIAMTSPDRTRLDYIAVSYFSDLYPNVRYKADVLAELVQLKYNIHELGGGSLYRGVASKGLLSRTGFAFSLIWGHIKVFCKSLGSDARIVYVSYPAVFLVCMYSLLPRRRRPRIIMDAFISLYDTSVHDRQIIEPGSWRARLLYRLERRALDSADTVLVDSRENGDYYNSLFNIEPSRFVEMPLTIPEFEQLPVKPQTNDAFVCLFMGSMVPLQGIATVLAAASWLGDDRDIVFRLIGDGQDGVLIENYLRGANNTNVHWERRMMATDELVEMIEDADLCLGIFGDTAKADRVIPYKLYYYSALGKPFLSMESAAFSRLADSSLTCPADAETLAQKIRQLKNDPDTLAVSARASRQLFDEHLSRRVQAEACASLISRLSKQP